MAAFETPWIDSMSPSSDIQDNVVPRPRDPNPPTIAAFSPTTITGSTLTSRQRSSIIVHRKSPLLVATPPSVTRALAHSHPFILPLNKLVGLLSWTSGDPWEGFLLVATFWVVILYGDAIVLWAGPIFVVVGLILGMYLRRFSPLSSTGLTGEKHGHKMQPSEGSTRHHKSLDEIVEIMREFTTRCNILLEPLLQMTDFLSTQITPTSATTRPALTALFMRILYIMPVWILLTLPPFYIISTRRVILIVGTIILTYHSRPARVSRVILWRSLTVRRICGFLTGLPFPLDIGGDIKEPSNPTSQSHSHVVAIATNRRADTSTIRFTFIVYENQRRWLGLGWTYSLFPNERAPWTDEYSNPVPPTDNFELPEVKTGNSAWHWLEGSEWRIDGADDSNDDGGWIYYDSKWQDGRRGQDGWGRYTRRRKWFRDAELVELPPSAETSLQGVTSDSERPTSNEANGIADTQGDSASMSYASSMSGPRRRRWFGGSKGSVSSATINSLNLNEDSASPAEESPPVQSSSRAIDIRSSHSTSLNTSGWPGSHDTYSSSPSRLSVSSSRNRKKHSGTPVSGGDGDSQNIRNREIEEAQNHLDRWGARATDGTERAEREMGLGDDVNMGLS